MTEIIAPFDLHVLGPPLAFILSQDQTLHSNILKIPKNLNNHYLFDPINSLLDVSIFMCCITYNKKFPSLLSRNVNEQYSFSIILFSIYKVLISTSPYQSYNQFFSLQN